MENIYDKEIKELTKGHLMGCQCWNCFVAEPDEE